VPASSSTWTGSNSRSSSHFASKLCCRIRSMVVASSKRKCCGPPNRVRLPSRCDSEYSGRSGVRSEYQPSNLRSEPASVGRRRDCHTVILGKVIVPGVIRRQPLEPRCGVSVDGYLATIVDHRPAVVTPGHGAKEGFPAKL
jgi:hypothetical protein